MLFYKFSFEKQMMIQGNTTCRLLKKVKGIVHRRTGHEGPERWGE
jgi:hypothetical protein